jgi:PAS domain S-box-containing protein
VSEIQSLPPSLQMAVAEWFDRSADRGVFVTDTGLVIRHWNGWLAAQTGLTPEEVVGRLLFDLFPTLLDRHIDEYYRDALAGQLRVLSERLHKTLLPITRRYHGAGSLDMSQAARIEPLVVGGAIVGTITVIEDVTDRVVTEHELRARIAASEQARRVAEQASRLKDEFLATLSHEIRTPLNAVIGWSRLLHRDRSDRSRARALEIIERNAKAQLRIVEDLLDLSRVVNGKLRLNVAPVALEDVVRAAVDVVAPAAAAKHLTVTVNVADSIPAIAGDADRLQQVVWNLLGNAVKFTDPGGRVDVDLTASAGEVSLSVRDSGAGISREFLPYVFDQFRQADASPSRRHGGLGLGLALVRHIVELHGGAVGVESRGAGMGATFMVTMPATPGGVGVPDRDAAAPAPSLRNVSVLVVDDDDDTRDLVTAFLQDYGAAVRGVSSAREALDLLSADDFRPDVLVSDVAMPGFDGHSLIRQIRTLPGERVRSIPAIALTAYTTADDRVRALVAGYQTHLAKPVEPAILAAAIADLSRRTGASPTRTPR